MTATPALRPLDKDGVRGAASAVGTAAVCPGGIRLDLGAPPVADTAVDDDAHLRLAPQQLLKDRLHLGPVTGEHDHGGVRPSLAGRARAADAVGDHGVGALGAKEPFTPCADGDHGCSGGIERGSLRYLH